MNQEYSRDELLASAAKHHSVFVAYAFGLLKNWSMAEDVVQDAYLAISDKCKDFDSSKPLFPWARGIVRNKCYEYIRAHNKIISCPSTELDEAIDEQLGNFLDKDDIEKIQRQKIQDLGSCFKSLNARAQRLLYNFYVQGRSCKEIAKAEGLEDHTPVNQLCRLRNQLRRCMHKNAGIEEDAPQSENENLLDRFFTGQLSTGQLEKIKNLLKPKDGEESILAQYVFEWSLFATKLQQIFSDSDSNNTSANTFQIISGKEDWNQLEQIPYLPIPIEKIRTTNGKRSSLYAGLAAMLCLSLGLWSYFSISNPGNATVMLVSSNGDVTVTYAQDKTTVPLTSGQQISEGDTIKIGENGKAKFRYLRENALIELSQNTVLTLRSTSHSIGKQLHLDTGEILVSVGRQPKGTPMLLTTPHATVTVLGTIFKLKATASKTSLSLHSGRAMIVDEKSKQQQIVAAGQTITLENGKLIQTSNPKRSITKVISPTANNTKYDYSTMAHFRFDEGQGYQVFDSVANIHGLIKKDRDLFDFWIEGKIGNAAQFAGKQVPVEIRVPGFSPDKTATSFSVAMWIKPLPMSLQNFNKDFFTIVKCKSEPAKQGWVLMMISQANGLSTSFLVNGPSPKMRHENKMNGNTQLQLNEWNHLVLTFEDGNAMIYTNGKLSNSKILRAKQVNYFEDSVLSMGGVVANMPSAAIDELSIHSVALDSAEIANLFHNVLDN